jgi:glyoxylase-like metal-dependent hydrolase (beta-lactamase superfamily II)
MDAAHDADAIVKEVACLYASGLGAVFTGDTLFQGGPGATGRSYSDRDLIFDSIRRRLLALPGSTEVHTGHGASTRISDEAGNCAA